MSFQAYIKFITTHIMTQLNNPVTDKQEKKNKHKGISHTWFGLFPFSFKLLFRKEQHTD